MRWVFELIAGSILVALVVVSVVFGTVFFLQHFAPAPCTLHTYLVIRINPSIDPLLVPTLMQGNNPRLIATEVMACGYEHVDGKTVFFTDELRDTLADVVHVQDQGPVR